MKKRYASSLLLFLGLLLSITACRYPNYTAQARDYKKQMRLERQEQKRLQATQSDSLALATKEDGGKGRRGGLRPGLDSSAVDSLATPIDSSALQNSKQRGGQGLSPEELQAQSDSLAKIAQDSFPSDSNALDSAANTSGKGWRSFSFSPDSVSVPVQYNARDSMIYDLLNRKIYLYGQAEVAYEQYEIKAGYIIINFLTQTATAVGITDSLGKTTEPPSFSDGTQNFDATKLEYNFRTKKGKVYEATTKQGDGFFLSQSTKFVSGDSLNAGGDIIYSQGCLYTTCNHKHPHFGIRSRKAKLIPNKLIVVGPSYLEIMGMPTPILLPFGFFPMTKTRKNGLILSTDIEMSEQLGAGIRGMGYYWRLSESADLAIRSDLYMRGSFRLFAESNYNKRYFGSGRLGLEFSNVMLDDYTINEEGKTVRDIRRTFNISWAHQQDPKAHPHQTFSAAVNFGSSDHFRNVTTTASQVLQSTFNSNIAYTRRFPNTPFTMSLRASHSQNTQTGDMNVTLPGLDVTMNQIFPLKRKNPVGRQRWYERVAFRYNMNANNSFTIRDSVLFSEGGLQQVLDTMEYTVRHTPNLNFSLKILKHFNLQPSIRYTETWHFRANDREFDPTVQVRRDTIRDPNDTSQVLSIRTDTLFGQVNRLRNPGFNSVRDFGAGATLNTQIFATGVYNLGRLRRMWARFEPNVGFNWRPDYSNEFWGYYGQVQNDTRYPDRFDTYARFPGVPGQGASSLLTYGLNMRWEAEVMKSKRDTSSERLKKVIILNNFQINGDYNMAIDSLQWSVVRMNASTTLFKLINVMLSASMDPYEANPLNNQRINTLVWDDRMRPVRLTSANFTASMAFGSKQLRELFGKKEELAKPAATSQQKPEFFQGFAVNYSANLQRRYIEQVDSLLFSAHELSITGLINLSEKWSFRIGRVGYDFANKRVTYPDFTFARDLHCWQMGMNWQPEIRTWNFFIRVKPSSLGFINVPVRRNQFDNRF